MEESGEMAEYESVAGNRQDGFGYHKIPENKADWEKKTVWCLKEIKEPIWK